VKKPLLLIPVENQVREMEAKLLIAVLAARRGYRSIVGWKGFLDQRIGRYPPSIYFAKSIAPANTKMLRIKRELGHFVMAWDEEAVVHYPADIYHRRRVGEEALRLIDCYVAWGEDNRELMESHPDFRPEICRVLGNPRADLLRSELREFSRGRADELRERHGDFILVNTNFGSVNGYTDTLNLMREVEGEWVPGRGSHRMPIDYARGLFDFRSRVLEGFRGLIPEMAARFPDRKIILRPHPSEDHEDWRRRLASLPNVEVLAEGNVVPWLMACDTLVHNGCTTAVEGFLLGTRIASYVPEDDERYEFALPNALGRRCRGIEEISEVILGAEEDPAARRERRAIAERFIASLEGDLSAQRIVDALESCQPRSGSWKGRLRAEIRALTKRMKQKRGTARYDENFRRQRFPEISVDQVQDCVNRLAEAVHAGKPPQVRDHAPDLFEIEAVRD
jgi:surface carbohydrate biosynthesis protein